MLNNVGLAAKITFAITLAIGVVATLLTLSSLQSLDGVIADAERSELDGHVRALLESIEQEGRMARALSSAVAALPSVQERFAVGDRTALGKELLPLYTTMANDFDVEQFQLHTPPATSFLRLHKPEKFGDDLSTFRHTVVAANQERRPVSGLESGVAGLGLRGVVPVFGQGRHVGSLEFGLSFGQPFFDAFKARRGIDAGLHLMSEGKVTTFASTATDRPLMGEALLREAFAGRPQLLREGGRTVYAVAIPDYSGTPIGVVEVAMDRARYLAALKAARDTSLLEALAALAFGLLVAALSARHLTRRILLVKDGVNRIAQGDLTIDIPVAGSDEVGTLAEAARQMRRQLHAVAAQARENSSAVLAMAREIAAAVESQAATSSQMSASVAEITSTMEELSASSTQIAEHSTAVVDISTQTWEQSKRGSDAMRLVTDKMSDIRAENASSLAEILALGHKSKEIGRVMEIINAVADQTKLIAFNAALEAASAGDAGRRFGVVAAEIRRLADSVTDSTGEIEAKVNEIQDAISRLVITSERGATAAADGMSATANTAGLLGELEEAAHQSAAAAQQISLSTQQQKTASGQVVLALREIVAASSNTAESINRISDISREMSRLAIGLDRAVGQFRLDSGTAQ